MSSNVPSRLPPLPRISLVSTDFETLFRPLLSRKADFAKHLRKGRQEDSHEFLRYAIDALQKSCLAGLPPSVLCAFVIDTSSFAFTGK